MVNGPVPILGVSVPAAAKSSASESLSSSSHSSLSGSIITPDAWSKLNRWFSACRCGGRDVVSCQGSMSSTGRVGNGIVFARCGGSRGSRRSVLYRFLSVSTTAGVVSAADVLGAAGSPFRRLWPFFNGSHGCGRTPFRAGCPYLLLPVLQDVTVNI